MKSKEPKVFRLLKVGDKYTLQITGAWAWHMYGTRGYPLQFIRELVWGILKENNGLLYKKILNNMLKERFIGTPNGSS